MLNYAHSISVDDSGIRQIFEPLVPVLELQEKFSDELDKCVSSWKTQKGLGELFKQYVRRVIIFSYLSRQALSASTRRLQSRKVTMKSFCRLS